MSACKGGGGGGGINSGSGGSGINSGDGGNSGIDSSSRNSDDSIVQWQQRHGRRQIVCSRHIHRHLGRPSQGSSGQASNSGERNPPTNLRIG